LADKFDNPEQNVTYIDMNELANFIFATINPPEVRLNAVNINELSMTANMDYKTMAATKI